MENTTKVRIYYDETHKSKKTNSDVRISIDYISHTEIDREKAIGIKNTFKKYMSVFNCDRKDIIDIINKIRELTEDLSEYKLEVSLKKNNYWEFAKYERGRSESCGVYKEDWDDYIGVIDSYNGIDVRYKVDRSHLYDISDIKLIHDTLFEYYEKVMKLNNMQKEKIKEYKNKQS